MARILFGLLVVVAAVVQATILPRVNPLSVTPDLVLVLLFLWAIRHGVRESLLWIFFSGLFLDLLTLDPFGTNGLALVVIVLLASPARHRLFQSGIVVPILLIVVVTIIHGVVLTLLRGMPMGISALVHAAQQVALQAGMHAVLVPIVHLITRWMDR
ncbi:MAG: rod shape-determining protein MreD [Chloroflexota bacterium]|nr:rod shape-determining protein MreD [Chloroflexota bacterium]